MENNEKSVPAVNQKVMSQSDREGHAEKLRLMDELQFKFGRLNYQKLAIERELERTKNELDETDQDIMRNVNRLRVRYQITGQTFQVDDNGIIRE